MTGRARQVTTSSSGAVGEADVSVCICVHNEERTIGPLLEQVVADIERKGATWPIYVMADDCTDQTEVLVARIAGSSFAVPVRLVSSRKRRGKLHAINEFLRLSGSAIAVFADGDVEVSPGAVTDLVDELTTTAGIGAVTARRITAPSGSAVIDLASQLQDLAHNQCEPPKVGRLYAIWSKLAHVDEQSPADDTYQEWTCTWATHGVARSARASVRAGAPRTARDYVRQRRRNVALHLGLWHRTGYRPSTLRPREVLTLAQDLPPLERLRMPQVISLEIVSQVLGLADHFRRRDYTTWPDVNTAELMPACAE